MNIPVQDARGLFTKALIERYSERVTPTSFLRSFFKVVEKDTKELSIEVQRGTEKVAVDVMRGVEGNRNTFSKSSEKIFIPPYFREFFDMTDLDLYDRVFGTTNESVSASVMAEITGQASEKLSMLVDKINRAYELQCAQVLQTGIVILNAATNIDFKRKAGSMVDLGGGNYWAVATVDPTTSIIAGCTFLRNTGKATGGVFNMICGATALADMLNNPLFQAKANLRRIDLMDIQGPETNVEGGTFHGEISAGTNRVRIWSYDEIYVDAAAATQNYIDPKNIVLIPIKPTFTLGFGAVPVLKTTGSEMMPVVAGAQRGAFVFGNRVDPFNEKHVMDVKSAGVAIPTAVDQIYTAQVVA